IFHKQYPFSHNSLLNFARHTHFPARVILLSRNNPLSTTHLFCRFLLYTVNIDGQQEDSAMTQVTNLVALVDRKVGSLGEFTSNRALAEHVGVSEGTIRNLRRMCDGSGKYHPTLDTLNKLSEAFPETTLAELQRLAGLNVEPVPEDREERVE